MSGIPDALQAHLDTGLTTLCQAWAIERKDGVVLGFTDHDEALSFEGVSFKADTGMSAATLLQASGLSVDNTEAVGALSDISIAESDIVAGRFDGAQVRCWVVNWQDVAQRWLQFRGFLGELRRGKGAFHAELRGLTDLLNQPVGRLYQKSCTAVLGDAACGVDLSAGSFRTELTVENVTGGLVFEWSELAGFEVGWFTKGRLDVLTGGASGLWSSIKTDEHLGTRRRLTLWEELRAEIAPGDRVRLSAGCDKTRVCCTDKFSNFINFQGFPDIPGEDWLMAVPKASGLNDGGSRR